MNTSEILLNRKIRSYSLILCICLLITNWLCLGLLTLLSNLIQSCLIQSYFLHVFIYFHLHLIIYLHFYWYYKNLTYCQFSLILIFIFLYLCLLTLPSIGNEWGSIIYDKILQICIVNYTFNYSYTYFLLTFTCLIPFILLIISHKQQMKILENKFNYSFLILIWTFLNILFLIFLHIPIEYKQIRISIYYMQIILFLIEPILCLFISRSSARLTTLKSSNQIYFL